MYELSSPLLPCGPPAQNETLRSESAAVRRLRSLVEMSCRFDLRAFSTSIWFFMRVTGACSSAISCVTIELVSTPEARPVKLMPFATAIPPGPSTRTVPTGRTPSRPCARTRPWRARGGSRRRPRSRHARWRRRGSRNRSTSVWQPSGSVAGSAAISVARSAKIAPIPSTSARRMRRASSSVSSTMRSSIAVVSTTSGSLLRRLGKRLAQVADERDRLRGPCRAEPSREASIRCRWRKK